MTLCRGICNGFCGQDRKTHCHFSQLARKLIMREKPLKTGHIAYCPGVDLEAGKTPMNKCNASILSPGEEKHAMFPEQVLALDWLESSHTKYFQPQRGATRDRLKHEEAKDAGRFFS